jgi:hypothetical protein
MRDEFRIPYLSFPEVVYGPKETPWNLDILLYKGGAKANSRTVRQLIACGALGDLQLDRVELVQKLHAEISSSLASGNSRDSANKTILYLRLLFGFADDSGLPLTIDGITDTYCTWADSLYQRTRANKGTAKTKRPRQEGRLSMRTRLNKSDAKAKPPREEHSLSMKSAWYYGADVGTIIDRAIERRTNIIELTRLYWRPQRKTAIGTHAEKQNLSDTFAFGHLVQDICDGLSLETVLEAPFPIKIFLRSGQEISWATPKADSARYNLENEGLAERYHLANLRIEGEMLMFIGQTSMNVKQALNLELRHFFYVSHLDGYQVKDHKERRGGTVLFEIFKDYRPHFERYLAWRRKLFPGSKLLFPFIGLPGTRQNRRFQNHRVREVCLNLELPYIPPRDLRNTRVNWLLRKSGDPDITAELAQHTKETLLGVYDRPSLQRALVESTRFWMKVDPHQGRTQSVVPGDCTGVPLAAPDRPMVAPKPDCMKASGCLWCENHRDVDSLDYVWALSSFMHLKRIELSKARIPLTEEDVPPTKLAIGRIQEKLSWYEQSNELRRDWVQEAQIRITEEEYHPDFCVEIFELEGGE